MEFKESLSYVKANKVVVSLAVFVAYISIYFYCEQINRERRQSE